MRLVLILAIALLSLTTTHQLQAVDRQPNIIFILADDLGYGDLGCFGQRHIRTPELDRMATDGLRMTRHYSGSTVCAPSRYTLLTGRHIGRSDTVGQAQELPPATQNMASILGPAGYRCTVIGKWGLGEKSGHPLEQGFHRFFGFLDQSLAHHHYPDWIWDDRKRLSLVDNPRTHARYIHDDFTNQAIAFIEQHRTQPFFVYLAYTLPHAEVQVPDDSQAVYIPLLGDPERPPIAKPYVLKGYNEPRYPRAARAGMVSRLDRDVGRIRDRLAELGLAQDTLIVFTSDNGPVTAGGQDIDFFKSSGELRGAKRSLYEGGIRVPTIVCWPGVVPAGREDAYPSISYDWLPTLAAAVGATIPRPDWIDGVSLMPVLTGRGPAPQRSLLYWDYAESGKVGQLSAVQQGAWKLVVDHRAQKNELFDLERDPQERSDRSQQHPEVVRRLRAIIDAKRQETLARSGAMDPTQDASR